MTGAVWISRRNKIPNDFAVSPDYTGVVYLAIQRTGNVYAVTYPATASNYLLLGAALLPPAGTFVPITNPPPPVVDGQYIYTLPGSNGYHFFELGTQQP